MKWFITLSLVGQSFFASAAWLAAPIEVGGTVPSISAKDQHGKDYVFTNGTAFLLVATDMVGARAANRKLAEQGPGFLEKQGAVYLMDIHPMPGVARLFALPKMRKYPQRIVLIETAGALNWVPAKTNQVTVLKLTPEGRVKQISFWQPDDQSAIEALR